MRGIVLISFISSPQQKRAIGCPGSYLCCSAAVMLWSKTKVMHTFNYGFFRNA